MKKKIAILTTLLILAAFPASYAAGTHGTDGQISGRSVGASICSLLIWPGIGQAINGQSTEKNVTHAVLGLTGIFRLWSFYDAIIDRQGGVWHNRI